MENIKTDYRPDFELVGNDDCTFKRGDKVKLFGGKRITVDDRWNGKCFEKLPAPVVLDIYPLKETYIWASIHHLGLNRYVIWHPNGISKEHFIREYLEGKFADGFESIHSGDLSDEHKYMWVSASEIQMIEARKNNSK